MAECPNCGTEVRPEWSLCPHCKVNMRTYAGPRGGFVQPVTPIQIAPSPATSAPVAAVAPAPLPTVAAANTCPHCGAALPSPDAGYCPQCGDPVSETSAVARMRRLLSNRRLVGALAVVFIVLLAGILLAGQGQGGATGVSAQAADVGPLPSPTVTAFTVRASSTPTSAAPERIAVPRAANASGNVTPRPNETVLVVKTLDRYIQNAGGDPGSQLRTPFIPATPAPLSPVPTSASGRTGNLSWSGEGTYVTEPFALDAGTIQVGMTAGVLTMAQLRNAAGTAIGIATAGPQPAMIVIRVAVPGTYRLEVWPFGSGTWTVTISDAFTPTVAPTFAPATVTTAAPAANVSPEVLVTTVETVSTTQVPTETPTTSVPTPTPMPTQESRTFQGNGTHATPPFTLHEGVAIFTCSTTGAGNFSVTLVGSGETVLIPPIKGPYSGSKGVSVSTTGQYLLNVEATGLWEVSLA